MKSQTFKQISRLIKSQKFGWLLPITFIMYVAFAIITNNTPALEPWKDSPAIVTLNGVESFFGWLCFGYIDMLEAYKYADTGMRFEIDNVYANEPSWYLVTCFAFIGVLDILLDLILDKLIPDESTGSNSENIFLVKWLPEFFLSNILTWAGLYVSFHVFPYIVPLVRSESVILAFIWSVVLLFVMIIPGFTPFIRFFLYMLLFWLINAVSNILYLIPLVGYLLLWAAAIILVFLLEFVVLELLEKWMHKGVIIMLVCPILLLIPLGISLINGFFPFITG